MKYIIVVTKKSLGLFWHVRLVSNYRLNIEEILMHSQNYYSKSNAVRAAKALSNNLNIPMEIED